MARRRSTLQRTAEIPGSTDYSDVFEGRARLATIAVLLAFVAVFFGTATIFQIEDDNPLTGAAFDAVPLLGISLMSAHLAALAALVAVVLGAGRTSFAMWRTSTVLRVRLFAFFLSAIIVGAAVASLGLVVLYVRLGGSILSASTGWPRVLSFFIAAGAFAGFVFATLAIGRKVTAVARGVRQAHRRPDSLLWFCVGAVLAMLVNVAAAITHTVTLRSGSPELFADSVDHVTITGSTSSFYFSELAVANAVTAASTVGAAIFVARAVIELRVEHDVPAR